MLRYFQLSDTGEDSDAPRVTGKLCLTGIRDWDIGRHGLWVAEWDESNTLRLNEDGPTQDMPWTYGYAQTVSDRLRKFFILEAPGCVQFLPVKAFLGDQEMPQNSYWVANWLCVIDCIDWRLSKIRNKIPNPRAKLIWPRIIDLNKAHQAPLFIVKEQPSLVLIRSDLKDKLQYEGFTGCQYYKIEQHD